MWAGTPAHTHSPHGSSEPPRASARDVFGGEDAPVHQGRGGGAREGLFSQFSSPWGEGAAAESIMSPCLPALTNLSSCTQNSSAGEPRLRYRCEITSRGHLRGGEGNLRPAALPGGREG